MVDVSLFLNVHVGDWMRETSHLSPAELGVHLRLVMASWARGGVLPKDRARLARLGGVSAVELEGLWPALAELWTEDGETIFHQPTVDAHMDAVERKTKATNKARGGAQARWGNVGKKDAPSTAQAMLGTMLAPCPPISDLRSPGSGSENASHSLCSEASQEPKPSEPKEPALAVFPCTRGQTWELTESVRRELADAFPAVDVLGEAKRALEWLKSNPERVKTRKGTRRFLSTWCARQQDRPTGPGGFPPGFATRAPPLGLPRIGPLRPARVIPKSETVAEREAKARAYREEAHKDVAALVDGLAEQKAL